MQCSKLISKVVELLFILCFWLVPINTAINANNKLFENTIKKSPSKAITSIDTQKTILKVKTAFFNTQKVIIGSSYEGMVLAFTYEGEKLWENKLSGYVNHDLWIADVNNDGNDEIITANASGTVFCINYKGETLWKFQKNEVPMYSVCTIKKENETYIVAGGLDLNLYYLSNTGKLIKTIHSASYSTAKVWHTDKKYSKLHYANFLRPSKKDAKNDILVLHASNNHMQGSGQIYLFNALDNKPYKVINVKSKTPIGALNLLDLNGDHTNEIVLGTSSHQNDSGIAQININAQNKNEWKTRKIKSKIGFGYSVVQPELIKEKKKNKILLLVGNRIILTDPDFENAEEEEIKTTYSYYDICKENNHLILASAQSGGSCIHIINTNNKNWKKDYTNLRPIGKIQTILNHTNSYRNQLKKYTTPKTQRAPLPVYLLSENLRDPQIASLANNLYNNYKTPVFLGGSHMRFAENWDRSRMPNEKYKKRRDRRKKYTYSQNQVVDHISNWYQNKPGIAYWGGHGNDPYMYQLSTTKRILNKAKGKKTVLIFPELEDHSEDFAWVMDDLFYPLADYSKSKNANIFVRTKHNFWQANIYLPMWKKALDGNYANIFVPSMEETTDKAMDISVASRSGLWTSGAFNHWGTRAVPDNPSYDRSRQFSHQRLPNHFLRHMVYHIASGATYINNFAVDQQYMSFLWELIGKGALFVPKPNEILSYSPVHLSMKAPHEDFLREGSDLKWAVYYDEKKSKTPFVFGRQNATWPGAQLPEWDYSSYIGNVTDRRQNYLPNYPNGMVLITPPQEGVYASKENNRGQLQDHLHPIYKNILKEYITDGKSYFSADGKNTYPANTYYKNIKNAVIEGSQKLPLTVKGNVAWVVAQTAPDNLRLTLIDGGYLNPNQRKAIITFNTVTPVAMKDILDGKEFNIANPKNVLIDVPTGLFRFIDIKIKERL